MITPKNGDFVSYQRYYELLGLHYRIHRLCGIAGDFVELKDGVLFVNGNNADAHMNLIHYYKISVPQIYLLFDYYSVHEFAYPERTNDSVYRIHLDDDYAGQNGFSNKRIILDKNEPDQVMQHTYNQNWNKDNFGPLQIPEGKTLVLGNNRDNSEDSRYFGLINLKDIKGIKGRLIYY